MTSKAGLPDSHPYLRAFLKVLAGLLPLLIFGIAVQFLSTFLDQHSVDDILEQARAIPTIDLVAAGLLTCIYYLLLSTYDLIAFMYLRNKLARWKIVITSLIAYALSNSTGFGGVAGNAFRFRNYMHYGVKGFDVLKVLSMVVLSFWLGTLAITGFCFLFFPLDVTAFVQIPKFLFQLMGGAFLSILGLYLVLCYFRRGAIHFGKKSFRLPSFRLTMMQVSLASADWILGAAVLFVLLPPEAQIEFPVFVAIFSAASLLALIANVPGGLGVLEALILFFVGPTGASPAQIMGSLVLYRFFLNFCPFALSLTSVAFLELKRHFRPAKTATAKV